MVKKRAPNCPSISLANAIEKVERVYSAEGLNTFDGEVGVRLIGYNGLNGASRRALGALRSYGLVSGRGDNLRVSKDAVVIIADAQSPDQAERQESLRKCLTFNRVFADLVGQYGQGSTLLTITAYLQKHYGFKANAAKRTAKLYKESVSLIHWGSGGITFDAEKHGLVDKNSAKAEVEPLLTKINDPTPPSVTSSDSPGVFERLDPKSREDNFVLDEGQVKLRWPRGISPENFEDLTDWLLIMHRRIARDVDGDIDFSLVKQKK